MGYRLLPQEQAEGLPHSGGSLGLDIRRGQVVTDADMTFEILLVSGVRPGSAGAQAGLKPGDQIIAVDGMVFANLAQLRRLYRVATAGSADHGRLPPERRRPATGRTGGRDTRQRH